jgi:peptidoglycan/LPS O-acetylase OafA/YrhL
MSKLPGQNFIYLDILRFLSFLLIFLHHCNFITYIPAIDQPMTLVYPRFHLGVQLFFCLSAFLLTHLAIAEYASNKRFSQLRFLVRRGLRIYPLYFLFIALVYLLVPLLGNWAGVEQVTLQPVLPFLLFYNNFYNGAGLFMLTFLWSIAVEEQFYIFYSFVLKFMYRWLVPISIILLLVYIFFRTENAVYAAPEGHHTLNYLPCFASGIVTAVLFNRCNPDKWRKLLTGWKVIPFYVFAAWLLFAARSLYQLQWFNTYEHIFYAIVFCGIIFHLSFIKGKNNLFERALVFLGRRTYGLYIWHGLVLTIIYKKMPRYILDRYFTGVFFIALAATILLAVASYRLWEAPFLKLKSRFR